jgi:hypothetical protein
MSRTVADIALRGNVADANDRLARSGFDQCNLPCDPGATNAAV